MSVRMAGARGMVSGPTIVEYVEATSEDSSEDSSTASTSSGAGNVSEGSLPSSIVKALSFTTTTTTTTQAAAAATDDRHSKMNYSEEEADGDERRTWISWHVRQRGNEFLCEVDDEFILDRFNLTGLGHDVPNAQQAYDLLVDSEFDWEDGDLPQAIEASAQMLYGLIHARFIITPAGLQVMERKYVKGEFGSCPRVLCEGAHLLPAGVSDVPAAKTVKAFCPRCCDVYEPERARNRRLDGAYFGTTFPHLFLMTFPQHRPSRERLPYEPRVFGFRLASSAALSKVEAREAATRAASDGGGAVSSPMPIDQ